MKKFINDFSANFIGAFIGLFIVEHYILPLILNCPKNFLFIPDWALCLLCALLWGVFSTFKGRNEKEQEKGRNKNNRSRHYSEVDIIKGVAILLVILVHSGGVKYINMEQYSWYTNFVEYLRTFDMPLFFMVSGFLFANSGKKPFLRVMKGKFDRLVVPYFVLSFITLAVRILTPALFHRATADFEDALTKIFFYGYWYWFIYTLFVLYVVFTLIKPILSVRVACVLIVILIIIKESWQTYLNLPPTPHIGFLKIHQASYFGAFFLMGYVMYPYYEKIKNWLSRYYVIALFLALYAIGCYYCITYHQVSFLFNWALPIVISLGIWGICIHLVKPKIPNEGLSYFGKYSLQVYLFNGTTLGISRELLVRVFHVYQPVLLFVLMFIVTTIISVVFIEILRRIPTVRYFFGFGRESSFLNKKDKK